MTKSTLFDRLNHELEVFGRKAQAALDEGKLQIELLRLRRRQDNTARDLGLLVHRRERGGESEPRRIEALLTRLDELQAEIARVEQQVTSGRQQRAEARQRAGTRDQTGTKPQGSGSGPSAGPQDSQPGPSGASS